MKLPPIMLPVEVILGLVTNPKKYGNEKWQDQMRKKILPAVIESVLDNAHQIDDARYTAAKELISTKADDFKELAERVESKFGGIFKVTQDLEGAKQMLDIAFAAEMGNIIAEFKKMPSIVAASVALAILVDASLPMGKLLNEEYAERMRNGADLVKESVDKVKAAMDDPDGEPGLDFVKDLNKAMEDETPGIGKGREARIRKAIEEARNMTNTNKGDQQ